MEDAEFAGQGSPAAGAGLRALSAPGIHASTSLGLRGPVVHGAGGLRGVAAGGLRAPDTDPVAAAAAASASTRAKEEARGEEQGMLDEMSQRICWHDAIGLDHFSIGDDPSEPAIEEEDVVEVPEPPKHRGGNYSVAEDEALVLAWQEVSQDAVVSQHGRKCLS